MKKEPTVEDAIKAIREKSKIRPASSPEDYPRFAKEMDEIDKK